MCADRHLATETSRPVVVIGNFDGVHLGHQALLEFAAKQRPDQPLVAVTFEPHTMAVVRPQAAPLRLTPSAYKEQLLRAHGAQDVVVVPFDTGVSAWTPREFIDRVLAPLRPSVVVVGAGFRFGHKAAGTADTLAEGGRTHGFAVEVMPLVTMPGEQGPVPSSSGIRAALADGEVEAAARMLGRDHRVSGLVVPGDRRGRALLGFPTANLPAEPGVAVPADGVYAGWLTRLDEPASTPMPAAISVGTNPTFNGITRRVESYVLDRDDLELYGVPIAVDFSHHIRGQITFDSIEPLIAQMRADVDQARTLLTADPTD